MLELYLSFEVCLMSELCPMFELRSMCDVCMHAHNYWVCMNTNVPIYISIHSHPPLSKKHVAQGNTLRGKLWSQITLFVHSAARTDLQSL